MSTMYLEDPPGRHPLKAIIAAITHQLDSTYVDLCSYPTESWRRLKLLWDYEHGDYYAVLEIDSLEPKYRLAIYKISSNHIARGSKSIPTYVGFSADKLPSSVAEVAIDPEHENHC